MCAPLIVAAPYIIAAASAAAQYAAQRSAANAQADASNKAANQEMMNLGIQQSQQGEAAAQQANEHAKAAARDAATLNAISSEYGGGNTTDRLATTQGIQQDEHLATVARNAQFQAQDSSLASMSIQANNNARLASISRPSAVGTALQIGGAYANYRVATSPPKTKA